MQCTYMKNQCFQCFSTELVKSAIIWSLSHLIKNPIVMEASLEKSKEWKKRGQVSYGIELIWSVKVFTLCDLLIWIFKLPFRCWVMISLDSNIIYEICWEIPILPKKITLRQINHHSFLKSITFFINYYRGISC